MLLGAADTHQILQVDLQRDIKLVAQVVKVLNFKLPTVPLYLKWLTADSSLTISHFPREGAHPAHADGLYPIPGCWAGQVVSMQEAWSHEGPDRRAFF